MLVSEVLFVTVRISPLLVIRGFFYNPILPLRVNMMHVVLLHARLPYYFLGVGAVPFAGLPYGFLTNHAIESCIPFSRVSREELMVSFVD